MDTDEFGTVPFPGAPMLNELKTLQLNSRADGQIFDLTGEVQSFLAGIGATKGIVTVSGVGSTLGVTTVEYEPGLVKDIPEFLDRILPAGRYHHDQTWHDGNGHSHMRSTLIGTSRTFPVSEGEAVLGTWQQVILIDFDNKPRKRQVVLHFLGE
jgi:secondary thiamine-phosphate synthase enzyme